MEDVTNQTPTEQKKKGCTGDCKACSMFQRGYCASQIAYNNMGLLCELVKTISQLRSDLEALTSKVDNGHEDYGDLMAPTVKGETVNED